MAMMDTNDMESRIVSRLRDGLISWYDFKQGSQIFFDDKRNLQSESDNSYDYVVCKSPIDSFKDPHERFKGWRRILKVDGILLFPMNNRMGISLFCGDRNPYTEQVMDREGLYTRSDVINMLQRNGFYAYKFYSVFSNLENPSHLFAYGYRTNEDLVNRLFPCYHSPDTVFMKEETLYRDMIDNDVFHSMANAYLIEASMDSGTILSDALQITSSSERDPKNAFFTIVHDNGIVTKQNVYPEGAERFDYMELYAQDLRAHGVDVVEIHRSKKGISMPYIDAPTGQLAMREALLRSKDEFICLMDKFMDCIMMSSDIEKEDADLGPIMRYGYIDLLPLNSAYDDGKFIFFDQEFRLDHYPVKAILYRMIATFYVFNDNLEKIVPRTELLDRYGLMKHKDLWEKKEWDFLAQLRNEDVLRAYHLRVRRNDGLTERNLKRMNCSYDRYEKVLLNTFADAENKDIYIFGSGRYAERFIELCSSVFRIKGAFDNNHEKWGKKIKNIEIESPDVIKHLNETSYKIIICIKDYVSVISQLDELGVCDFSVFDGRRVSSVIYEIRGIGDERMHKKLYHTGYVAGAFDMFHIGHLNLLRRAKERCDYLIVGVISDDRVFELKKRYPVIPCNERMQVVAGCRYVDRVEELPVGRAGIMDAYNMFHFDCMFSGDDHTNDPGWIAEQDRLRKLGSDIVFVPYTKETSSTEIRQKAKTL